MKSNDPPPDWKEQLSLWSNRFNSGELLRDGALMMEFNRWCVQPWVQHLFINGEAHKYLDQLKAEAKAKEKQ